MLNLQRSLLTITLCLVFSGNTLADKVVAVECEDDSPLKIATLIAAIGGPSNSWLLQPHKQANSNTHLQNYVHCTSGRRVCVVIPYVGECAVQAGVVSDNSDPSDLDSAITVISRVDAWSRVIKAFEPDISTEEYNRVQTELLAGMKFDAPDATSSSETGGYRYETSFEKDKFVLLIFPK